MINSNPLKRLQSRPDPPRLFSTVEPSVQFHAFCFPDRSKTRTRVIGPKSAITSFYFPIPFLVDGVFGRGAVSRIEILANVFFPGRRPVFFGSSVIAEQTRVATPGRGIPKISRLALSTHHAAAVWRLYGAAFTPRRRIVIVLNIYFTHTLAWVPGKQINGVVRSVRDWVNCIFSNARIPRTYECRSPVRRDTSARRAGVSLIIAYTERFRPRGPKLRIPKRTGTGIDIFVF